MRKIGGTFVEVTARLRECLSPRAILLTTVEYVDAEVICHSHPALPSLSFAPLSSESKAQEHLHSRLPLAGESLPRGGSAEHGGEMNSPRNGRRNQGKKGTHGATPTSNNPGDGGVVQYYLRRATQPRLSLSSIPRTLLIWNKGSESNGGATGVFDCTSTTLDAAEAGTIKGQDDTARNVCNEDVKQASSADTADVLQGHGDVSDSKQVNFIARWQAHLGM